MAYTGILTNGLMPAAYLLGSPAHEEMAGWQTTATPRLHMEHLELTHPSSESSPALAALSGKLCGPC